MNKKEFNTALRKYNLLSMCEAYSVSLGTLGAAVYLTPEKFSTPKAAISVGLGIVGATIFGYCAGKIEKNMQKAFKELSDRQEEGLLVNKVNTENN